MNEKQAKRLTWAILLLVPILPSYMVIAALILKPVEAICIFLLEYFAFQYLIAMFIKKLAERIQYDRQKKEEALSQENKEVKTE